MDFMGNDGFLVAAVAIAVAAGAIEFGFLFVVVARGNGAVSAQEIHGAARDATPEETAAAMREGKRTPLDAVLFDDLEPQSPSEPSPIPLGRYYDEETEEDGDRNLYSREQHILLFGLNGMGKFTRILAELLLTSVGRSIVVLDIKGELAAVTAPYRRTVSDVKIINPFGLHVDIPGYEDLESGGFDPLGLLDPASDEFYDDARALADALIRIEGDSQPHFPQSARSLVAALIMWEKYRNDDNATLGNVRQMLTEAEEWEIDPGTGAETLVRGLKATAKRIKDAAEKDWRIAEARDLTNRFLAENTTDEIRSIQSTADTQTEWLLSRPLRRDMAKNGVDFRQLGKRPTTVYIIMPLKRVDDYSQWIRLVITAALIEQMRAGGLETLFVLDEFYAAIGDLKIIKKVWAAVRAYGIKLMPILQGVGQLKELWKENWETMAGQAGAVVTIGPAGDEPTAEWMSKRSGTTTKTQAVYNNGSNTGESTGGPQGRTNTGTSSGTSYSPVKVPHLLPQDFRNIAVGMGRIWTPTQGDTSHPMFAPNYWMEATLRARTPRPNPYRKQELSAWLSARAAPGHAFAAADGAADDNVPSAPPIAATA